MALFPGVEIPSFSGLQAWQNWYTQNWQKLTDSQQAKYEPYLKQLNSLIGYNKDTGDWDQSKWPTYNPVAWQQGTPEFDAYKQDQAGLDAITAKIGAGPMSSTDPEVLTEIAARYGMSLASWTGMAGGILDAEGVLSKANELATMPSELKTSQAQADRVAQRAAAEQVGKQIEAIFGEKGTSAGFAAAYDLTLQMSSQFMQQRSQREITELDRAFQAVEAQNGYYQDLIAKGAIQAGDYIKFRYDSLSTAYQTYLTNMQQHMQEWQTSEEVAMEQAQTEASLITQQVNAITAVMAQMMGVDNQALAILNETLKVVPAPETDDPYQAGGQALTGLGSALLTAGGVAVTTVAGAGIGTVLLITGAILTGVGWLIGLFS